MNALSLRRRRLADARDLLAEVRTTAPPPAAAVDVDKAARLADAAVSAVDRARRGRPQPGLSPAAAAPFALVVGDSGGVTAELVVIVFHTPAEADTFARQEGFAEWTAAPIRFALDATPPRQPMGAGP